MANKKFLLGILVLALVFGMGVAGCGNSTSNVPKADITYTATANGTAYTETTTQLSLTFSAAVSGLTAQDITITAGTGAASKGALTGSGTSWNLSITVATAGTVEVKITKTGIESGEKTVTVHKTDGSSKEKAIPLSIAQWEEGSVFTEETKWYKFEAASGTSYCVQWVDSADKPEESAYTGDIIVSAFKSDGTPITEIQDAVSGWSYPEAVSGVSGTVYLKVEPYNSYSAGTYAIRFYDPAIVVPQILMSISFASAVPVPAVVVTWNSASSTSGISGYRVYRSNTETGTYTQIGSDITSYTSYSTIHYTDMDVSAGSTYWYKVAAYNSAGEGGKSAAKQSDTVPNTGVGTSLTNGADLTEGTISTATQVDWYTFTAVSGTTYRIQWADSWEKPGGSTYTGVVQVSAFSSDGTPITSIQNTNSGWTTSRTVSGVSGTVYLKVEPYNSYFAGTYAIRFYDPAIVVPQISMSISYASAVPVPAVVVTWNSSLSTSGISGYRVYRSNTETGTYTQIGSDITSYTTTSYTDTDVSAGSTYWYKVAAYNSVGEGGKSAAKQSDTVPNTGVGTSLTIGADLTVGIISTATQVNWYKFTAVSGTTYRVQWADSWEKPGGSTYTGVVQVSAFSSDGTPITAIQNIISGWTNPGTVSGVSGTVYLKVVVGIVNYTGTYGIKVYQE